MRTFTVLTILAVSCAVLSVAQVEQEDNDVSLSPGGAIFNLLSGQPFPPAQVPSNDVSSDSGSSNTGLLNSQVEFLKILTALMELKGEIFYRLNEIFVNNYDIIVATTRLLLNKIRAFHNFALVGLSVLTSILEYFSNALVQAGSVN